MYIKHNTFSVYLSSGTDSSLSTKEEFSTTKELSVDSVPENIRKIDLSLDPTKAEERERAENESMQIYDENFGSVEFDKSYGALFELLWYGQMPCFDVKGLTSKAKDELSFLKRCYWKGKLISCTAIFQQRPTDHGMCCSFNMQNAENSFRKSKYTDAISARQMQDAKDAYEPYKIPKWYTEQNEPKPEAGRDKGLVLIVDGHSNKQSAATVRENFRGFITVVDGREKFPLVSLAKHTTRAGFVNNVDVNAINMQAKPEIRRYKPERRKCYFPDEYQLKIHQKYSRFNCLFECKTEFASRCIRTCSDPGQVCDCKDLTFQKTEETNGNKSCTPWFYPVDDEHHSRMCNPWNTEKFLQIIENQLPKDECKHCLADCETTEYETTISYAPLRKCDRTNVGGPSILCSMVDGQLNPAPWVSSAQKEFIKANKTLPWYLKTDNAITNQHNLRFPNHRRTLSDKGKKSSLIFPSDLEEHPAYDAFEEDIGILNVFFGKQEIMKYLTKNVMSEYEFFSQIGGSLGFIMGISIISMIEIIYWFIIRLFGRIVG